jgi:DNA (cytosine-5)-methyltransferase 1
MPEQLTIGSTFTGIGGADLGFEWAGFRVAWQCEFDAWKQQVLRAHWPDVPLYDDITTLHDPPAVDVMLGGFPCQDLSVAGKRKGFDGERSALAFEFLRIARAGAPRWIVLENVPGLLSSNRGRDFARLVDEVVASGYGIGWRVLDARHFGVAQARRRVFLVARRADAVVDSGAASRLAFRALCESSGGDSTPGWPARPVDASGPGDGPVGVSALGDIAGTLTKRYAKGVNTTIDDGGVAISFYSTGGSMQGFAREDGVSHTLKRGSTLDIASPPAVAYRDVANALDRQAGGPDDNSAQAGHLVASHPATVRRLTCVEAERLMGLPDGWTAPVGVKAPDSKRYSACGDAIVTWVAYWIAQRIRMIEEEA